MPKRIGRLGILGRRVFVVSAVVAVLAGAAFLFVPFGARDAARLELVALGEEARFGQSVTFTEAWADTTGSRARVPLVLGISNVGGEAARPERVDLSVPARFQLRSGGRLLPGVRFPGESLVRYRLVGDFQPVEPGRLPTLLPGVDTLWLEPVLQPVECTVVSDSIPELVPARLPEPADIAEVPLFYSIEGGDLETRHTGLLEVRLDHSLLAPPPAPDLVYGPVELRGGGFEVPDTLRLGLGAGRSHTVACGPPESPLRMGVTAWESASGGRLLALELGGKTRKLLVDMDGDGLIERMLWDPDADGRFEAMQETRVSLPPFLLPPVPPSPDTVAPDSLLADSLRADSARRDSLARAAQRTPPVTPTPTERPAVPPPVTAPPPDTAPPDTTPRTPPDTTPPDTSRTAPPDTSRTAPPDTSRTAPPDTTRPPPTPPDTIVPDTMVAPPDTSSARGRVPRRASSDP